MSTVFLSPPPTSQLVEIPVGADTFFFYQVFLTASTLFWQTAWEALDAGIAIDSDIAIRVCFHFSSYGSEHCFSIVANRYSVTFKSKVWIV